MLKYLVLVFSVPILVGAAFQTWIGDIMLTLGIIGLTLILSSTIVCIDIIRRMK